MAGAARPRCWPLPCGDGRAARSTANTAATQRTSSTEKCPDERSRGGEDADQRQANKRGKDSHEVNLTS